MRTGILAAASLALVLGAAAPASATAMIDVDNLNVGPPSSGDSVSTYNDRADVVFWQTFTVGASGRLTEIDLFGASAVVSGGVSNVELEVLRGGSQTTIGQQSVGLKTMAIADVVQIGVTAFDLSGLNIFVTAGETMTFKMSVEACTRGRASCQASWVNWTSISNDASTAYAGGAWFRNFTGGSAPDSVSTVDLNFRTWVDSAATPAGAAPEPASWALMIVGFGSVGVAVRRRRERTVAALG